MKRVAPGMGEGGFGVKDWGDPGGEGFLRKGTAGYWDGVIGLA